MIVTCFGLAFSLLGVCLVVAGAYERRTTLMALKFVIERNIVGIDQQQAVRRLKKLID